MDIEIWKKVEGFPNYEVSSLGRVKNCKKDRILKTTIFKKNKNERYITIILCDTKYIRKAIQVHRLVAITFIPNINNKPQVNHINGIKNDNRVVNLEWVTDGENKQHSWKIGLRENEREFHRQTMSSEKNPMKKDENKLKFKGSKNPMAGRSRTGINAGHKKSVICLETGCIFITITDANNWIKSINKNGDVQQCATGKSKTAGGYHWKYTNKED